MTKIIAFANQKGGVAKTTSTHNIGVALAQKGKKVLLIDLDSQASLTISTGIEPLDVEQNIINVLDKGKCDIRECIQKINDNLHIITSTIDLASLEMEMLSRASREKILDRALEPIKGEYDFILLDCPPQLSILTINALSCADGVIIPCKTDYLSYRGIEQLMETIAEVKELINPKLEVLGTIATLFNMRANDDKDILNGLKASYNVLGVVKMLVSAKKGIYDGMAVVESEPKSEISVEYIKIADMLLNENYEREVV
jgi:chromosome partitioning protein